MEKKKLNNMINFKDTEQLEKWVSILIKNRISQEVDIYLENERKIKWVLSSRKYDKKIKIILDKNLYKVGYQKNLQCPSIKLKNIFFSSKFEYLPAPGSTKYLDKILCDNKHFFTIKYDIIGLAFWMLNRCEEINSEKIFFDKHRRFKSCYSHSVKNNYHMRPIVDEWFIFLREVIKYFLKQLTQIMNQLNVIWESLLCRENFLPFGEKYD